MPNGNNSHYESVNVAHNVNNSHYESVRIIFTETLCRLTMNQKYTVIHCVNDLLKHTVQYTKMELFPFTIYA